MSGATPNLASILMPCHNAAKYVAASIESALAQTWPRKEIIVVDDGSTDESWEILQRFAARGVKCLRQERRGAAAARNRAFRESGGAYIKFLDSDDLLARETVELQMRRLAESATAVATCEWGRFYGDDLAACRFLPESVWRDMDPLEWLIEEWTGGGGMMQPGLFLIPRGIADAAGPWDEELSLTDDFEYFSRVLCRASEVRFATGARVYYRSGVKGSLSSLRDGKAVQSAFASMMGGTACLLACRDDERARLACANVLQQFVYNYYPLRPDLIRRAEARIAELGGSTRRASGPPHFELLRRVTGWKCARRVQRALGR